MQPVMPRAAEKYGASPSPRACRLETLQSVQKSLSTIAQHSITLWVPLVRLIKESDWVPK